MGAENSLLTSILAEPHNEDIRLVFADWCEEQGDPRADFIRVQLALEKLPPKHHWREEMEQRETKLFQTHGKRWNTACYRLLNQSPLRRDYGRRRRRLRGFAYHRGFVELLRVEAQTWLKHWELLRQLGPICRLRIFEGLGFLEELAQCQGTKDIVHLSLSHNQLSDGALGEFLAHCPPALKSLDLSGNALTTIGAGLLLECDVTRGLDRLVISENAFTFEDIELLQSHFGDRLLESNGSIVGRPATRPWVPRDEDGLSYDDHFAYVDGRAYAEGVERQAGENEHDLVDPWTEEDDPSDFFREEDDEVNRPYTNNWWNPPEEDEYSDL